MTPETSWSASAFTSALRVARYAFRRASSFLPTDLSISHLYCRACEAVAVLVTVRGFGALQVWQSVSEAQGRGQGQASAQTRKDSQAATAVAVRAPWKARSVKVQ